MMSLESTLPVDWGGLENLGHVATPSYGDRLMDPTIQG
jgi:hypothetical protein